MIMALYVSRVGYLGITHVLPVDKQVQTAVHALKGEDPVEPVRHVIIVPLVDAHGICVRHKGRIKGYRITDAGVLGHVMAVKLPV